MKFIEQIKKKIESALPGATVNVLDQSSEHQEHNPVGAHLEVHERTDPCPKNKEQI
ncbi:hypothetical protein HYU21_03615 [Candidatus Woesearchaeota archaeon]|nr:hypothetical protein [Candidatus Woesearchaeota archaeon]